MEAKGWEGERDASVDAPICIQNNPYTREKEISGTEDCLYLNVYTPKVNFILELLSTYVNFYLCKLHRSVSSSQWVAFKNMDYLESFLASFKKSKMAFYHHFDSKTRFQYGRFIRKKQINVLVF